VAVQERDTGDGSFVLDNECVGDDGYWQSKENSAVRWVVPQWKVLAAGRGGWRAGLKGLMRVNESDRQALCSTPVR
jgi:hypothetical protein